MEELLAMGLMGIAVAGGAIGVFLTFQRRAREAAARAAAWRELAARHGGSFSDDARYGTIVEVAEGEALVRGMLSPARQEGGLTTRFAAPCVVPAGPSFVVVQRTFPIAPPQPGATVDLGPDEAWFSRRFVVVSTQPDATREVLTARARRLLAERVGPFSVRSDGVLVELVCEEAVSDLPALEAAVALVAEVAQQPQRALALLRSLPQGVYHPAEGTWEHRRRPWVDLELRGAVVSLELASAGGKLAVVARAPRRREGPVFELHLDPRGRLLTAVPEGVLTPHAAEQLPGLGQAMISGTPAQIEVVVHGAANEPRLVGAAHLAATLASDSPASAFR